MDTPTKKVPLDPAHVAELLRRCPKRMRTYFVLNFFCGIRPAELSRLRVEHINLDSNLVWVSADVAKVRGKRAVCPDRRERPEMATCDAC